MAAPVVSPAAETWQDSTEEAFAVITGRNERTWRKPTGSVPLVSAIRLGDMLECFHPKTLQEGARATVSNVSPDRFGPQGSTADDLPDAVVGDLTPHNAPITIAEYDPEWPKLFEREAERIESLLGDTVEFVEHVGSTSVPGLPAKPIIDILLAVPDSSDESSYLPALEEAGYVLEIREPDWYEHRLLKGPDTDINLRVFTVGAFEIERMLRFRDHLRTHDADRDLYASVKRDLGKRVWRHVQDYADAKTDVVGEILHRAFANGR